MAAELEEDKKEKERDKKKWLFLSPIAKPLVTKKLNKRALKIVKKASKTKQLKRGVKEVVKALRKGQKGLCLIAGDISPIDVITHLPILCEEAGVPYVYVPSKEDLGAAGATKRPTSCMLILPRPPKDAKGVEVDEEALASFTSDYEEVVKEVQELAATVYKR